MSTLGPMAAVKDCLVGAEYHYLGTEDSQYTDQSELSEAIALARENQLRLHNNDGRWCVANHDYVVQYHRSGGIWDYTD